MVRLSHKLPANACTIKCVKPLEQLTTVDRAVISLEAVQALTDSRVRVTGGLVLTGHATVGAVEHPCDGRRSYKYTSQRGFTLFTRSGTCL